MFSAVGVQALRRGLRSCGRRSVKKSVSVHWIRSSSYFWVCCGLSFSLHIVMCLAKLFPGLSATRYFFPVGTAYGIFLAHCLPKQCLYSALIVTAVFSFLHLFTHIAFFFFSFLWSIFFFFSPTFNLLKLLHPYFGVKILFDVIINWENSEHDAMDEGSSPSTPFPLLSWWKVFNFGIQPQALVQSTVSIISPVREENKKCSQICKSV